MVLNDCVISNVNNSPKWYFAEYIDSEIDSSKEVNVQIVNSDWRPSKNPKYDRKYTSSTYPFYGKVLTESYLSYIIPIDSLWHILNQPGIQTVGFIDENVIFEPKLIDTTCYSTLNSEKEYVWNYNLDRSGAEIYFTHNLITIGDCSDDENIKFYEKTLRIYSRESIYNTYLKEIMSICQFDESSDFEGNIAQKFTYIDKSTNQKCNITCTRIIEKNCGEILIYWKMKN